MAVKRTKDGTVDMRTKEGKEMAARMAKAREARKKKQQKENGIVNRLVRLLIDNI